MDRPDDEKYWTTSANRGFDFDADEAQQDNCNQLFGFSQLQTAQLSKELKEHIPPGVSSTPNKAHPKLSHSISSMSSGSTSSNNTRTTVHNQQCEITNKLLLATINVESVLTAQDVVRSIFLGMSYDLNSFKKLSDKKALLDEAVKLGDGDVLCAVILYLQKNLHTSVLFPLLKLRLAAAEQYIDILEMQGSFREAALFCAELQRPKEAAIHFYKSGLMESTKSQLAHLQNIQKNEFRKLNNIQFETEILNEHIQLLERQIPLAADSPRAQKEQRNLSSQFIGVPVEPTSLVGSSTLATLQYCCRYNWGCSENLLASPSGIRKLFTLTERQYTWNAFIGRLLATSDPLPIVLVKGMFGVPKIAAGLSIPRMLEVAFKLDCQTNVLDQLLPLIESAQERYRLAKRYQRHRIVIDVLASNKDRIGLLRYKDVVTEQAEIEYINNILRVSSTRWKN